MTTAELKSTAAFYAPAEHVVLFDRDGEPTDDVDGAVVGVTITDRSPAFYDYAVEVYAHDGTTLLTHSYQWDPNGRELATLDEETAIDEARDAVRHMAANAVGERSTVLLDHGDGNVWHVAAPGTSGKTAAKEIDEEHAIMPRRYYTANLDSSDSGYDVYLVPTAIAQDLEGQCKHDTALVQLFDCVEQIHYTDADEDDYEGRCDSLAGADLDRDYD